MKIAPAGSASASPFATIRSFNPPALIAACLAFTAVVPPFARAQSEPPVPLPAGVSYVTSVEGINEYRLTNGLRVPLFADPTKSNIKVNITYMVGSRHEDYGETGMAHLIEHLQSERELDGGSPAANERCASRLSRARTLQLHSRERHESRVSSRGRVARKG